MCRNNPFLDPLLAFIYNPAMNIIEKAKMCDPHFTRRPKYLFPRSSTQSHLFVSMLHCLMSVCLLIVVSGLFWSCASEQKKPTPVTIKVGQIQKTLSELGEAYVKKDKERFFAEVDPASISMPILEDRVLGDFKHYSKAELSLRIHRVELGESTFRTSVHWKGVWKSEADLPVLERSGKAIFILAASEDPKLINVLGDSPFGVFR